MVDRESHGRRQVVDRESHGRRKEKEAIWIRKTEAAINQDEGNYELPHIYNDVILPGHQNATRYVY